MFHIFDILPSTNDYCLEYAKNNPGERLVCLAHQQTLGRGRNGKTWDSANTDNLYLSYLRPTKQTGPLSLVTGLVIAELLESWNIPGIQLKWPNDVFILGAKIAGILIEGPVIGIGLNLTKPSLEGCTALSEFGLFPEKIPLAEALIERLEAAISRFENLGFETFLADWQRFDCLAGHQVTWENGRSQGQSLVLGVNKDGGLVLEQQPFVLYSGSVKF